MTSLQSPDEVKGAASMGRRHIMRVRRRIDKDTAEKPRRRMSRNHSIGKLYVRI